MSKKNDSNPSNKRRDALRKLAISGGVIGAAGTWSKPVVDSVVLPAHAQISLGDPCDGVTIKPFSSTQFNVKVSGHVSGAGAGFPVHVEVRVSGLPGGPEIKSKDIVTGPGGDYSVLIGLFDGCAGPNVLVTISSPAFAGVTQCSTSNAKTCDA